MNKLKTAQMTKQCPNCESINMGKLNRHSYYCRECCAEVVITKKNHIYVRIHAADGTVIKNIKVDN